MHGSRSHTGRPEAEREAVAVRPRLCSPQVLLKARSASPDHPPIQARPDEFDSSNAGDDVESRKESHRNVAASTGQCLPDCDRGVIYPLLVDRST